MTEYVVLTPGDEDAWERASDDDSRLEVRECVDNSGGTA